MCGILSVITLFENPQTLAKPPDSWVYHTLVLKNDVPGTLVALSLPDQPVGVKGLVIGFFLSLVVFMDEHFVVHSKVHKPLVRLLRSCVEPELDAEEGDDAGWRTKESAYEEAVVEVMCRQSLLL